MTRAVICKCTLTTQCMQSGVILCAMQVDFHFVFVFYYYFYFFLCVNKRYTSCVREKNARGCAREATDTHRIALYRISCLCLRSTAQTGVCIMHPCTVNWERDDQNALKFVCLQRRKFEHLKIPLIFKCSFTLRSRRKWLFCCCCCWFSHGLIIPSFYAFS